MNTGSLNRRISYTTAATYTDTALGGKAVSVAGTTVTTWCSARQLSMNDQISYGLPIDVKVYEFGFHYERGANISFGTILTYETRQFKVLRVTEINEAKREIKVVAANQ